MTGLRSYAYRIPDGAGWQAAAERLRASGQVVDDTEREGQPGLVIADQDGNRVEVLGPAGPRA
jgi:hypothetical protein